MLAHLCGDTRGAAAHNPLKEKKEIVGDAENVKSRHGQKKEVNIKMKRRKRRAKGDVRENDSVRHTARMCAQRGGRKTHKKRETSNRGFCL